MTQQDIFRRAWTIARLKKYHKLLWFGFIPAFISTVVLSAVYTMRGYQYWVELFEGRRFLEVGSGLVESFFGFLAGQPVLAIAIFILGSIFLGCYMLLPIFFHGGLIRLTEEAIHGKPLRLRMGIIYSSQNFLKLFETNAITQPFKLSMVFIVYWLVRTFEPKLVLLIIIPLGCWLVVSVIINILLLFSEYYMVLKGEGIFASYLTSMRTVFLNLEEVVHMVFLCILIALRVLLNTTIALGIPLLVMYLFSWFTSSLIAWLAWPVAIIIGLIALTLLSYINAIFAVFLTAAWTLTFLKYTETLPEEPQATTPDVPQEHSEQIQMHL